MTGYPLCPLHCWSISTPPQPLGHFRPVKRHSNQCGICLFYLKVCLPHVFENILLWKYFCGSTLFDVCCIYFIYFSWLLFHYKLIYILLFAVKSTLYTTHRQQKVFIFGLSSIILTGFFVFRLYIWIVGINGSKLGVGFIELRLPVLVWDKNE